MSDPSVNIRDAGLGDLDRIAEIEAASFPDPYPRGLLKGFFYIPGAYIVAVSGGRGVGYAIGIMRWRTIGHVVSVAVDPSARGAGTGEMIMHALIERLSGQGAKRIRLEVRASNEAAKGLYRKLGFEEKGKIERYYADGESAVCMFLSVKSGPQR